MDEESRQANIAALALRPGKSIDGGEARMALLVTLQVIDEADLRFDADAERIQGLLACLVRASDLTSRTPMTPKTPL